MPELCLLIKYANMCGEGEEGRTNRHFCCVEDGVLDLVLATPSNPRCPDPSSLRKASGGSRTYVEWWEGHGVISDCKFPEYRAQSWLFRPLSQNTIDWMAYKQPKFISHNSWGQKCKIKAPANSLSGEKLLAGEVSSSHGCNQTWTKEEGALCGLS